MYKLLIVDDEIHAIRGIEASLDWQAHGISEIFSACNIRKAKEILANSKIQILICDIEMPQGSGLDLLAWTVENQIQVMPILLTCHAKFEYAQKAISLGALDYLLKPVDAKRLETVVIKAIRTIDHMESDSKSISLDSDDPPELTLVDAVRKYIHENMSGDLTREKIAQEFHFSPDYLSKIVKKDTGQTIAEFLFEERIKIAKDLLMNSDMPISDIVSFIGYANFSHFSKVLKKYTGMTPLNFRKAKGNQ